MFTVNQELSRVQENGRYASGTLLYDIRMAGFAGCRSLNEVAPNIVANTAPTFSAVTDGLNVFENGVGWTNPTAITRLAGTDVNYGAVDFRGGCSAKCSHGQRQRQYFCSIQLGCYCCH